jgi:hypothetical protein
MEHSLHEDNSTRQGYGCPSRDLVHLRHCLRCLLLTSEREELKLKRWERERLKLIMEERIAADASKMAADRDRDWYYTFSLTANLRRCLDCLYKFEREELELKRRERERLKLIIEERIAALDKMATDPLRDVWRFTCPLNATWNLLNPFRNNTTFQHWGVAVADVGKDIAELAMKHRKEPKGKKRGWGLGFIHELSRVGRQSGYRVYKWMSNAVKSGWKLLCVGKTSLTDDEILSKGIQS